MLLFFLGLGLVGCGDDDGGGGGGMDDAGMPDSGRISVDSGPRPDAGPPPGDGNDTPETADDIMIGAKSPTAGVLNPPGDDDWYTFEGMADQWIQIITTANMDDDPELVDTVLTLYDSTMTQIAENDDRVPRVNTDSEIVLPLPETGTYYLRVQEFSEWDGDGGSAEEGDPTFTYELQVIAVEDEAPVVTLDTETGDDVTSAIPISTSMDFGYVLGTFEDDTDVDVFTLTIEGTAARAPNFHVMPHTETGYGSTATARMWVTDAAGATIIARIDQTDGYAELQPSLLPGTYQLFVEHATPAAGANDFYVIKAFVNTENPLEMAEVTNDLAATPEAVPLTDRMDMTGESGFILAHVITDMDVDHFSFDVTAMRTISIACGSAENGSGVVGLQAQLIGPDGTTVVAMQTEMPPEGIFIMDATPMGEGTHLLRLSKASQSAEITGDWVRCGIHTNAPMP